MKILHIIDNLDDGGAQELLLQFMQNIDRKKYQSFICCLKGPSIYSEKLSKLVEIKYLKLENLNPLGFSTLITLLKLIYLPYKYIKEGHFDIVHTHLFKSNIFGLLASIILRQNIIVHDHSGIENEMLDIYIKPKLFSLLYKKFFIHGINRANCLLIVINKRNISVYQRLGISKEKIVYLPNGVEIDAFEEVAKQKDLYKKQVRQELEIPPTSYIVGMVGRLSREKGWKYFFLAAREILRSKKEVIFLAIGDGKLKAECEKLVKELRIERNVLFLGHRTDIPRLLCAFDVFVLSSIIESFGIVILEALCLELPVIATKSGGPEEIIQDGQNGFLVPPADYIALAKKIKLVLDKEKKLLNQNTKEYVRENFSIQSVVNILSQKYDFLVAKTKKFSVHG